MEVRKQGAHRRTERGAGRREVVRPQLHGVLGDQQRHAEEAFGQQTGQGGGTSRGGVAEVHGTEALLVVPVEGERTEHPVELRGEGEEVGDGGGLDGAAGAGRTAGRLQDPYRGLGAERRGKSAVFAGQFGETVEAFGEPRVPGTGGGASPVAVSAGLGGFPGTGGPTGVSPLAAGRTSGADRGRERGEVGGEAPSFTPPVGARAAAGQQSRKQPPGGVQSQGVLVGDPQRRRPYPAHLERELDPATRLLFSGAAEREEIELVLRESAHQTVAPESGLTGRIRITTVGEESDPHEYTPDLPCGRPPLERRLTAGRP